MNSFLEDFRNAWGKPNNGLIQLIIINIVVFLAVNILMVIFTLSGAQGVYHTIIRYFMLPASIGQLILQPWTIVTYFFMHEAIFHVAFNMLFLYWFGRIINEYLGSQKVINLYVLGGLAGGVFYILIYNLIPYFHNQVESSVMLGASAGVFAIVVGAATLAPNFTVFLIFLGPVRIKYIALFYVVLSFIQSVGSNAGGELAHLGGALIGYLYIKQLNNGNDFGLFIYRTMEFFKSAFKSKPKVKVTYKSNNAKSSGAFKKKNGVSNKKVSSSSQDEIDAILDKISEKGYDSLTKEEKEKLFNASKQ